MDSESSLTLDLQPQSSIESQITDEEKEADKHMRVVSLPFQDNLLSQCIPAHQTNILHIFFSPLNQNTSAWNENYITIHDKSNSSCDHEEELLYQGGPKYSQVEERVILNESYISKPLDQALFQDPFVVFLKKSERVVGFIMNKLLPRMRKSLSTTVQITTKWEWPFHYFYIMKELNQNRPFDHLLDWLHWKEEFTKCVCCVQFKLG